MRYRIVQRRIVELDESKDYSEVGLEVHRRFHPETSRVVWRGDRDKDFSEKFLRDPKWHTYEDWPRTAQSGWVCYSYLLERFDEAAEAWQFICHIQPIMLDDFGESSEGICSYYSENG